MNAHNERAVSAVDCDNKQESAFIPYIHGSNSRALVLMSKTAFQMMPIIDMLEKYALAPLSGELVLGGYSNAEADGNPCFGRLDHTNFGDYTLDRVISYTKKGQESISKEQSLIDLKKICSKASSCLFSNINLINIYLARALQMGNDLSDVPEIQSLEQNFQSSMDVFYLYFLFGTYIVPITEVDSKKTHEKFGFRHQYEFYNELKQHFSLEKFFQTLQQSNISVREIYLNPTSENCQKIIDFFTWPANQNPTAQQLLAYNGQPVASPQGSANRLNFNDFVRNKDNLFCFMISDLIDNTFLMDRLQIEENKANILNYIALVEKRFELTQRILKKQKLSCSILNDFDADDTTLLLNHIPIILCSDENEKIKSYSDEEKEYRANTSLGLGTDIQIIATDSVANADLLQKYFNKHSLNLTVILFDDLKRARDSLVDGRALSKKEIVESSKHRCNIQRSVNQDIEKIVVFCSEQNTRLQDKGQSVLDSLKIFEVAAKEIVISYCSPHEKRRRLLNCAQQNFQHRHYRLRLFADALLLISSLALVGLAIGALRVSYGHSFFFSTEKTKREQDFIVIANELNSFGSLTAAGLG